MGNPKFPHYIRIIAGVYVIYLAYKIFRGGILGGDMQGGQRILGIAAIILFVGAGAYFAITSFRALGGIRKEQEEQALAEAAPDAVETPELPEDVTDVDDPEAEGEVLEAEAEEVTEEVTEEVSGEVVEDAESDRL